MVAATSRSSCRTTPAMQPARGYDARQAAVATRLIEASLSAEARGFISIVTLTEVVWVMASNYRATRVAVADIVEGLLTAPQLISRFPLSGYATSENNGACIKLQAWCLSVRSSFCREWSNFCVLIYATSPVTNASPHRSTRGAPRCRYAHVFAPLSGASDPGRMDPCQAFCHRWYTAPSPRSTLRSE
jgi:hypothetical protein